jgi:hypothetical protein
MSEIQKTQSDLKSLLFLYAQSLHDYFTVSGDPHPFFISLGRLRFIQSLGEEFEYLEPISFLWDYAIAITAFQPVREDVENVFTQLLEDHNLSVLPRENYSKFMLFDDQYGQTLSSFVEQATEEVGPALVKPYAFIEAVGEAIEKLNG